MVMLAILTLLAVHGVGLSQKAAAHHDLQMGLQYPEECSKSMTTMCSRAR